MSASARVRANRLNAQKSCGPKTYAGKSRSSKNALSHGLSVPISTLPGYSEEVQAIVKLLVDVTVPGLVFEAAVSFAEAQIQLMRVRRARTDLYSDLNARTPHLTSYKSSMRLRAAVKFVDGLWKINPYTGVLMVRDINFEFICATLDMLMSPPLPLDLEQSIGLIAKRLRMLDRYESRAVFQKSKAIARLNELTLSVVNA